jgi:uncharacterized protein YbjT (DUF2867 family)
MAKSAGAQHVAREPKLQNKERKMIVVTGATGNVGSEVVRQLAARGQKVRAFVRGGEAAGTRLPKGVEIARGDLHDPDSLEAALRGAERMYLLSPMVPDMQELEARAIDAAARSGVRHVVKHSNMGAVEGASAFQRWHRAGEKLLEDSKLRWTFVRPTGFMSNALAWAHSIRAQGAVFSPGGSGKLSVVDPRDIAAVAVCALTEPGHEGKAYDVTGPEALSTAEQIETISRVIGKALRYVDVPEEAARQAMLETGMPPAVVQGLLEFMQLVRAGGGAVVSEAASRVTGKPARTFEAWVRENAGAFR